MIQAIEYHSNFGSWPRHWLRPATEERQQVAAGDQTLCNLTVVFPDDWRLFRREPGVTCDRCKRVAGSPQWLTAFAQ